MHQVNTSNINNVNNSEDDDNSSNNSHLLSTNRNEDGTHLCPKGKFAIIGE